MRAARLHPLSGREQNDTVRGCMDSDDARMALELEANYDHARLDAAFEKKARAIEEVMRTASPQLQEALRDSLGEMESAFLLLSEMLETEWVSDASPVRAQDASTVILPMDAPGSLVMGDSSIAAPEWDFEAEQHDLAEELLAVESERISGGWAFLFALMSAVGVCWSLGAVFQLGESFTFLGDQMMGWIPSDWMRHLVALIGPVAILHSELAHDPEDLSSVFVWMGLATLMIFLVSTLGAAA